MQKYLAFLKNTHLFAGVGENEISSMLGCMQATLRIYKKGEYVIRQGERISNLYLLAEGSLLIQRDDYWGNRSIISTVNVGEMFGEAYATPNSEAMLNDVVAVDDSVVMLLDVGKMLTVCSSASKFHSTVVQNLFFALSEKNRKLVQKLGHMSKRTTREKLISYLSDEAKRQKSNSFYIPFNRQQLADFLSVDRSAMSNELCKMRDEGLLSFRKNKFVLY